MNQNRMKNEQIDKLYSRSRMINVSVQLPTNLLNAIDELSANYLSRSELLRTILIRKLEQKQFENEKTTIFSLALPKLVVKQLNTMCGTNKAYPSRAEFMREAIREFLSADTNLLMRIKK